MRRFCTVLLVLVVACVIGVNVSAEEKKAKKPQRAPEEVFKKLDKDGNGKLTLEELKAARKKPEQQERVEKFFKAKDKDNDGVLTLEEFKAPIQRKKVKKD